MVESIGKTLASATQGVTKVAAPTRVAAPETPVARGPRAPLAQLSGTAHALASSAPIDIDRVARIKRAIAAGDFPILPSTIADRLLALKMDWVARDEA